MTGVLVDVPTTDRPRCTAPHGSRPGPCNRPLTDPESVARGVGPCCWARLHPTPYRPRATDHGPARAASAGPEQLVLPDVCPTCGQPITP